MHRSETSQPTSGDTISRSGRHSARSRIRDMVYRIIRKRRV
ncbi:MAG: hypothetical protein SBU_001267 [Candidatus Syntrophoarchaeum butanivorans]|uniref:Uncharacterized protein n=1 Tax=Candidatus Syntropharchaeum butanivorans TaxID=1839936 RepID=A0A1F2P3X0_9EURY|nr:MAG: hypothetical protein SBU_001267 [Candidatus Syntrophoarchaeum butanivorans]